MATVDMRIIADDDTEMQAATELLEELLAERLTLRPPRPERYGGVRVYGTLELPALRGPAVAPVTLPKRPRRNKQRCA